MKSATFVLSVVGAAASFIGVAALAQAPAPAPAAAPTEDEAARRATVYARFGDVTITVGDIEDHIAARTTFRAERYADPARLAAFADELVDLALLAKEAERRGLGERRAVARSGDEVLVQQFVRGEFDEPFRTAEVPDADVAAYYEAHRAEYVVPEQVRASHVLVATEEEARRLIEEVRGMDVRGRRQVARERSLDAETKLSGGDLRLFARDGRPHGQTEGAPVHPAIVEAAFSLRERGDVHPTPVPVDGRFSVVMLALKRPGVTRSLDEAAPSIRRRLNQDRRREAIDRLVGELEARVRPEKHYERLAPIAIEPTPSPAGLPPHPEHGDHAHGDHAH